MRRAWLGLLLTLAIVPAVAGARSSHTKSDRSSARSVLPFIVNDYSRALAEAKARKLPIFIEAWAPW